MQSWHLSDQGWSSADRFLRLGQSPRHPHQRPSPRSCGASPRRRPTPVEPARVLPYPPVAPAAQPPAAAPAVIFPGGGGTCSPVIRYHQHCHRVVTSQAAWLARHLGAHPARGRRHAPRDPEPFHSCGARAHRRLCCPFSADQDPSAMAGCSGSVPTRPSGCRRTALHFGPP